MKTYDHLKAHQDHRLWDSDIQMWSHDLKIWEQEIEALTGALDFINKAVKSHEEALADHYKALDSHHTRLSKHEVNIKYVKEGTHLDNEMFEDHKDEAARHELQRKAHERLKHYHHTIMALTKALKKALESDM